MFCGVFQFDSSKTVKILNIAITAIVVIAFAVVGALVWNLAQAAFSLSIGQISTSVFGLTAIIEVPVTVSNPGPFTLTGIAVSVTVSDRSGVQLLEGSAGPLDVKPGSTVQAKVILSFDVGKIPRETLERLMGSSEELLVQASLQGAAPPFLKLTGRLKSTLHWGAPVRNLQVGKPDFAPYNATHILVSVPVSFENDSPYISISGTGVMRVLDAKDREVGRGVLNVDAPIKSRFQGALKVFIAIPREDIEFLLFNDSRLAYRALMDFQSAGSTIFSLERRIEFEWGAPLHGLAIGQPRIDPYNTTHIQIAVPVSFENRNSFISIDAKVEARIFNATSNLQVGSGSIDVKAPSKSSFSGILVGFLSFDPATVNALLFNDRSLKFRVELEGAYAGLRFSLHRALELNWGAPLYGFKTGSPEIASFNASGIQVKMPVGFENHSPWIRINMTIAVKVSNATSGVQLGYVSLEIDAPPNTEFDRTVILTLTPSETALKKLLFDDMEIALTVDLSGKYVGFDLSIQRSLTYSWGAPLFNFRLGTPSLRSYNSTHFATALPVSFENHSPFIAIDTVLQAGLFNATSNILAGSGSLKMPAPSKTNFTGILEILTQIERRSLATLFFNDRNLQYKLSLSATVSDFTATISEDIRLHWGAPVKDLRLGSLMLQAFNSTHVRFILPFNFTNNAGFLTVSGSLRGAVFDSEGRQVGVAEPLTLNVEPARFFKGELTGYIRIEAAAERKFTLRLIFEIDFGTVEKEASINA